MYNDVANLLELPEFEKERFNLFVQKQQILNRSTEQILRVAGFKSEAMGSCPPFRMERSTGDRVEVIDFSAHQDWRNGCFEPELKYSLEAICHHLSAEEPNYILTKRKKVAQGLSFDELSIKMPQLLEQALQLFSDWTPEIVRSTGLRKGQFWSLTS